SYEILGVVGSLIQIDGACSERAWVAANVIPFSGFKTSDNTGPCRMLWENGEEDRIYGCCDIGDGDLRAIDRKDERDISLDDAFEYWLTWSLSRAPDPGIPKLIINIVGSKYDGHYFADDSSYFGYDSDLIFQATYRGTLNDSPHDTGYTIEWSAKLGFDVAP